MASAVLSLDQFNERTQLKWMMIMLSCEDDDNVGLVLKKALQHIPLPKLAFLFEMAVLDVIHGKIQFSFLFASAMDNRQQLLFLSRESNSK